MSNEQFEGIKAPQRPTPERIAAMSQPAPAPKPAQQPPQMIPQQPPQQQYMQSNLPAVPQSQNLDHIGNIQTAEDRPYTEFPLPKSMVGIDWFKSNFQDEDLSFGLTEINLHQGMRATRMMGPKLDFGRSQHEQLVMSIVTIGGKNVHRNRVLKEEWLNAIGPKGRQVVEHCWNKINTTTDSEAEAIFERGVPKG